MKESRISGEEMPKRPRRDEERMNSSRSIWPSSPPYKPLDRKKEPSSIGIDDVAGERKLFDLEEKEDVVIGPMPSSFDLAATEEEELESIMPSNPYGYTREQIESFRRAGYVMTGSRQIDGIEIVKITTESSSSKPKAKQSSKKPSYVPSKTFSDNRVLNEFKEMIQKRQPK